METKGQKLYGEVEAKRRDESEKKKSSFEGGSLGTIFSPAFSIPNSPVP
jgi:hypothetical protein